MRMILFVLNRGKSLIAAALPLLWYTQGRTRKFSQTYESGVYFLLIALAHLNPLLIELPSGARSRALGGHQEYRLVDRTAHGALRSFDLCRLRYFVLK